MNVSALDFKLGLRMLRRYPGITAIGTAAMAVGIALGMLYFEGLNKALHPTVPVADGDRIVTVRYWDVGKRTVEERSLHDFTISRTNVKTIEHFGAALVFSRNLVTDDQRNPTADPENKSHHAEHDGSTTAATMSLPWPHGSDVQSIGSLTRERRMKRKPARSTSRDQCPRVASGIESSRTSTGNGRRRRTLHNQ